MKKLIFKLFLIVNFVLITFPVIFESSQFQFYLDSENIIAEDIAIDEFNSPNKVSDGIDSLIYITNEEDFSLNGFTGSGTIDYPYRLANVFLTNNSHHISIYNTTVYFELDNITLDGISRSYGGIIFYNVTNGKICNSTVKNFHTGIDVEFSNNIVIMNCRIFNNELSGIIFSKSSDNAISNNSIYNNHRWGLTFSYAQQNNVSECQIYNNSGFGVCCRIFCFFNKFSNNTIYCNGNDGIHLDSSVDRCFIKNNIIYGNLQDGIHISYHSDSNQIINNNIFNNNRDGIRLASTVRGSLIDNNSIYNNNETGIKIEVECEYTDSYGNRISNNILIGNRNAAIYIEKFSYSNIITWNDLIGNEEGSVNETLVIDNGFANTFAFNYWENHIINDQNDDGIIDKAYFIHGNASNADYYPITQNRIITSNFLTREC